jgi:hypothetical protein
MNGSRPQALAHLLTLHPTAIPQPPAPLNVASMWMVVPCAYRMHTKLHVQPGRQYLAPTYLSSAIVCTCPVQLLCTHSCTACIHALHLQPHSAASTVLLQHWRPIPTVLAGRNGQPPTIDVHYLDTSPCGISSSPGDVRSKPSGASRPLPVPECTIPGAGATGNHCCEAVQMLSVTSCCQVQMLQYRC